MDRPIPETYWVRPGQFLAGEYPGSYEEGITRQRISAFLEAGFTHFFDLTESHELLRYELILKELAQAYRIKASYNRFAVPDFGVPPPATMQLLLTSIDEALSHGGKVYLHCWGGVGRTGTAVGCYLVHHGMSGEQALAQIAEWWLGVPKRIYHPSSPQTVEQFEYVCNWNRRPSP